MNEGIRENSIRRILSRGIRRTWILGCTLLLMLVLLTGCGKTNPVDGVSRLAELSEKTVTNVRQKAPVEKLLSDKAVLVSEKDQIYDLTGLVPALEGKKLWDWAFIGKGQLLLLYTKDYVPEEASDEEQEKPYIFSVIRLDIFTGETTYIVEERDAEIDEDEKWRAYFQFASLDPLIIYEAATGTFYDQTSDRVSKLHLGEDGLIYRILPQADGTIYYQDYYMDIYELRRMGGVLSSELRWKTDEGCESFEIMRLSENSVTLSAYPLLDDRAEKIYLRVNLETGTLEECYTAEYEEQGFPSAVLNGAEVYCNYGDDEIPLIRLQMEDGKQYSVKGVEGVSGLESGYSIGSFAMGEGCLFLNAFHVDQDRLLLWIYEREEPEEISEPEHTPYQVIHLSDISIPELETELEDAFGIEILTGNDALLDFGEYKAEAQTDKTVIFRSLAALRKAYEKYPEGFFEQLNQTGNPLRIYMVKDLIGTGEGTVSSAGGIQTSDADGPYIALAVGGFGPDQETICHETTHAIYDKLLEDGFFDEFYDEWPKLNPPDFSYGYTYDEDEIPDTTYTAYGDDEDTSFENVYFIRDYSKTFETEDVADFMGNLMAGEETPAYYAGPHLQAKGKYFFGLIRRGFDTTGWPAKTMWEERLESVAP